MHLSQVFELRRNLPLFTRHGFIIEGKEGGGSFVMRKEIEAIMANTEDRVIIIDSFESLGPHAEAYIKQNGGQCYNIMPGSDIHLSLLAGSSLYEDKESLLHDMGDLLLAMRETLDGPASSQEISVIKKTLDALYMQNDMPTTAELIAELKNRFNEGCSFALLSFLEDCELFQETTNITLDNRLTLFHIQPSIRGMGTFFPIMKYIRSILKTEFVQGKRTWIYIRHLDAILSGKNTPGKNNCIEGFWREARRFGAACTGTITKKGVNRTIESLLRNSDSFYFLTPSLEDDYWFKWLDVEPEGIVQMIYNIGGSKGKKGSITSISQEPMINEKCELDNQIAELENKENHKLPTIVDLVTLLKNNGNDNLADALDNAQKSCKRPCITLPEDLSNNLTEAGHEVNEIEVTAPFEQLQLFSGTYDVFGAGKKNFIKKLTNIISISVIEEDDTRIRFKFTEKPYIVNGIFGLQKVYTDFVALYENMKGLVEMIPVDESNDRKKKQVTDKEKVKAMLCQAIDNIPDCAEIKDCYVEHSFCSSKAYIHVVIETKEDADKSISTFHDAAHSAFGTDMGFMS